MILELFMIIISKRCFTLFVQILVKLDSVTQNRHKLHKSNSIINCFFHDKSISDFLDTISYKRPESHMGLIWTPHYCH